MLSGVGLVVLRFTELSTTVSVPLSITLISSDDFDGSFSKECPAILSETSTDGLEKAKALGSGCVSGTVEGKMGGTYVLRSSENFRFGMQRNMAANLGAHGVRRRRKDCRSTTHSFGDTETSIHIGSRI